MHCINPKQSKWADLLSSVESSLNSDGNDKVTIVSWPDWVEKLQRAGEMNFEIRGRKDEIISGIKLLPFFKGMVEIIVGDMTQTKTQSKVVLDTSLMWEQSETFRSLCPVSKEWMEIWLKQWKF